MSLFIGGLILPDFAVGECLSIFPAPLPALEFDSGFQFLNPHNKERFLDNSIVCSIQFENDAQSTNEVNKNIFCSVLNARNNKKQTSDFFAERYFRKHSPKSDDFMIGSFMQTLFPFTTFSQNISQPGESISKPTSVSSLYLPSKTEFSTKGFSIHLVASITTPLDLAKESTLSISAAPASSPCVHSIALPITSSIPATFSTTILLDVTPSPVAAIYNIPINPISSAIPIEPLSLSRPVISKPKILPTSNVVSKSTAQTTPATSYIATSLCETFVDPTKLTKSSTLIRNTLALLPIASTTGTSIVDNTKSPAPEKKSLRKSSTSSFHSHFVVQPPMQTIINLPVVI